MTSVQSIWKLKPAVLQVPSFFQETFGLMPDIARLLLARGLTREDQVRDFLHPSLEMLHDPFLFEGMQVAVERIRRAISAGERICIYGDYDADGVSSTALMIGLMRELKAEFEHYIPHREREGYGLHLSALDTLASRGVRLLVTVDTGISAVEQIAHARTLGMDVIVTDHHEAPVILPDAFVIINPKVPDCPYPFKGLAGVGVALKLLHALLGKTPGWALQLAAIGTVADMMPLTDENRAIVTFGLKAMNERPLPGLKLFAKLQRNGFRYSAEEIGFQLSPRINASGRLADAEPALSFLTAGYEERAVTSLQLLDRLNDERKQLVSRMIEEAAALAEQQGRTKDHVIIVAQAGWHAGVVGIVAAKLMERYHRSVIVLRIDEQTGLAKGSARSHNRLDLMKGLRSLEHFFEHYGGHQSAAGLTLPADLLDDFRIRFNEYARAEQTEEQLIPVRNVDLPLDPAAVSMAFLEQLQRLEPFGTDNPKPLIQLGDLRLDRSETMGKQSEHVKLQCRPLRRDSGASVELIKFHEAAELQRLTPGSRLHALVHVSIQEFRGNRSPQLLLVDWKLDDAGPAGLQLQDWRHLTDEEAALRQLIQLLEGDSGKSFGLLVGHQLDYEYLCDRLKIDDIQCHLLDHAGEHPSIGNHSAVGQVSSTPSHWIVWNMPHDPSKTFAWLQSVGNTKTTALFLQPSRSSGRLTLPPVDRFQAFFRFVSAAGAPVAKQDTASWKTCMQQTMLSAAQVRFVADVFCELKLMAWSDEGLAIMPNDRKPSLSASAHFRELQAAEAMQQQLLAAADSQALFRLFSQP